MAKKKKARKPRAPRLSKAAKAALATPAPGSVAARRERVAVGAYFLADVSRPTMPGTLFVVAPFDLEGEGLAFETVEQVEECLGDCARRRGFDHTGPFALPPAPAEGT